MPAAHGRADEVEMNVEVAAPAQVDAAGDVEEAGQLGQAVAVGLGAIAASSSRRSQTEAIAPSASAGAACSRGRTTRTSRARPQRRRGDTAEEPEPVARAEAACRARGAGGAGERGELAVGDDLAARDLPQGAGHQERRLVLQVDGDVVEADLLALEYARQALDELPRPRACVGGLDGCGSSCQTTTPSSSQSSPTPQPSTSYATCVTAMARS